MNFSENILIKESLIILVLYNIPIDRSAAYASLSDNLNGTKPDLFVYDNSFQPQVCKSETWNIIYKHDASNPGVSKAYNEGFYKAMELKKKWMLLVDQDTHFPGNFFSCLAEEVSKNLLSELFVPKIRTRSRIISPYRFKFGRGFSLRTIKADQYSFDQHRFINSGLLISISLFEKCHGYDERFLLDFSDLAFIERLRSYQKNFRVIDSVCIQNLSSDDTNLDKALVRFRFYLNGSRLFAREYGFGFYLFVNRILRVLKLSIRFESLSFLKIFLR